jgi:hypothetical protein
LAQLFPIRRLLAFDAQAAGGRLAGEEIKAMLGVSIRGKTIEECASRPMSSRWCACAQKLEHPLRFRIPWISKIASELSRATEFRIGDTTKLLENHLRELDSAPADDGKRYSFMLTLDPGESKEIAIETVLLKEASDNEIWSSLHPTLRADVSLTVRVPGLISGLRSRTAAPASELYRTEDGASARWQVDGPLLPNDSLTLWWQTR